MIFNENPKTMAIKIIEDKHNEPNTFLVRYYFTLLTSVIRRKTIDFTVDFIIYNAMHSPLSV